MSEPIIKVTSGDSTNYTFENDEYYTLNLLESEYYLITTENSFTGEEYTTRSKNMGNIELYARYVGKSRIDDLPLFAIDLASTVRKNKIDQIIDI